LFLIYEVLLDWIERRASDAVENLFWSRRPDKKVMLELIDQVISDDSDNDGSRSIDQNPGDEERN
jgi:hypothetical protein